MQSRGNKDEFLEQLELLKSSHKEATVKEQGIQEDDSKQLRMNLDGSLVTSSELTSLADQQSQLKLLEFIDEDVEKDLDKSLKVAPKVLKAEA